MEFIKHTAAVTITVLIAIYVMRQIPVVGTYTNKALVG